MEGRNRIRKQYEEKMRHGTPHMPLGLHKLRFAEGTDTIFYLHWHEEFEFLIVTKGEAIFEIEDRKHHIKEGEGVFINSDLLHSAHAVDGKECHFIAVVFSGNFLNESLQSRFSMQYILPVLNGKVNFTEHFSKDEPWQKQAIEIFERMEKYPEHDLEPYELELKSQIFAVWDLFLKHAKHMHQKEDIKQKEQMERLAPVLEEIANNYMYEIKLSELADIIPMSEGQFCRVFKKVMHMTPTQYVMQYRILQSCRLLMQTNNKISDIANQCGFSNISYFNKVFLKIVGCTPKAYREGEHNFTQV